MRRIETLIATLAVTLLLVAGCRTAAAPVGAQPSMEPATTTPATPATGQYGLTMGRRACSQPSPRSISPTMTGSCFSSTARRRLR